MKTENTPQNKAKFFAQYYPQKILHHKDYEDFCPVGFGSILSMDYYARNNYYLLLTPLKNISDEDAIEVAIMAISNRLGRIYKKDDCFVSRHLDGDTVVTCAMDGFNDSVIIQSNNKFSLSDGIQELTSSMTDFLRSKSYLLPYMDLSIEDLISYGWIKERES